MYINQYDRSGPERNRIINYGHYQKQDSGNLNFNNNSEKQPEEIKLSKKNKEKADHLSKVTLKTLKPKTDKKDLSKKPQKTSVKFDYYI